MSAPAATHMTAGEQQAYRAGVEAVRGFAQEELELHKERIRRRPHNKWSVTIGFLGGFGRVVDRCDELLGVQDQGPRS